MTHSIITTAVLHALYLLAFFTRLMVGQIATWCVAWVWGWASGTVPWIEREGNIGVSVQWIVVVTLPCIEYWPVLSPCCLSPRLAFSWERAEQKKCTDMAKQHPYFIRGNSQHQQRITLCRHTLLARDSMHVKRAICYRNSVCLSVCHMGDQSKTVEVRIIAIFTVQYHYPSSFFHPEIWRVPPERGHQTRVGWGKQAFF